ncbi:MAG: heme exporter protein CcmD [Pseudomonadota bacterium]
MDLGPHAAFIVASYAAVVIVLAGLTLWLILDGRHQRRLLEELEARGVRRRSAPGRRETVSGASS